ncbi:stemmadenine O-acetyltransferase-like isoform X2 [Ipomoea triloba]|uniref:stemmadenine O-acetyltransferase-like isoform X2 n=1 Tax=Ipomoea triloba TaxID=35885 RepID=UPI00125CFEEF|nr:stemmadenine O-acetyltransferase-like isoform X2 [Ipomoea triloba]
MVLKLELLSKEMMIKPSSPTPPHLKTLKLSFLDQTSPPFFAPFIFFFHHGTTDDHGRSSQLLKQSLSKVLTLFYPLAGRIKGNDFVDCSDDGALWVEARVHGFLKDVVENPLMEELEKFLPLEPHNGDDSKLMLAVQVNYFLDGGIGVAVCVSHKIGDAFSVVNFVNAWAVTAREGDAAVISPPNFGLVSSLFPPTTEDLTGSGFSSTLGMTTREKIVTRRVVFDKQNLAALKKSAAAESSRVGNPTRVEALSAFLWKRFRETSKKNLQHHAVKKTFPAAHAVNLRARMNPPLPYATFGNLWSLATTVTPSSSTAQDDLVFQLRTSIREINAEYVEALKNGKGHSERLRKWHKIIFCKGEAEFCKFSSWCRFPIYEVDFGWGKPVLACTATVPYKNVVRMMSTKCGDGIEAWINMGEDDIWEL